MGATDGTENKEKEYWCTQFVLFYQGLVGATDGTENKEKEYWCTQFVLFYHDEKRGITFISLDLCRAPSKRGIPVAEWGGGGGGVGEEGLRFKKKRHFFAALRLCF